MSHGAELQISVLGKLQINLDGQPVSGFVSSKVQALLCYLAVTGRSHARETLAALLWGDKPESEAKTNLRMALSNLRKLVGAYLCIEREVVAFNRESRYWLDAEIFEAGLAPLQRLEMFKTRQADPQAEDTTLLLQPLRQAVELYRGDFLEGFNARDALEFEEWMLRQREHLRQLAVQGLHTLAIHHTTQGEYATGIDYTGRLLAMEPWREEGHRQMMTLLARSGQRSAALAQYETCRHILAEELGVEPMAETTALYERLKTASVALSHNLPPQTTSFVGREAELARIVEYFDNPNCRLLTLVGSGGMGKTRLALQAAAHCLQLSTFQDGIFFVPLVALASPDLIVSSIVEALNLTSAGAGDLKTHLLNYLRNKELLLILDNFEHLLAGVDLIVEILSHAPHLKILATSRARLNLREEWVMVVGGLVYPNQAAATNPQSYSAITFFVQQAQRVRANFALAETNQNQVIRLCQLVNGIPLGLELAATWLPLLSCQEIVTEIERDFDFLTTPLRNIPKRHRSIAAVFESSWALLSGAEREVFEKLSIFRGRFEAKAAMEVTGASLALLLTLLSKSLLRRDASGRYDMHELIRQYAEKKLAERVNEQGNSVAAETAARHCHYYAAFLEIRENQLKGEQQRETLEEIHQAIENIRIAWQWAVQRQQIDEIERCLESLRLFYELHSRFQEGETAFGQAVEHLSQADWENKSEQKYPQILGRLLVCQGRLLYYRGLYDAASAVLKRGVAIFRRLDQPVHLAFALRSLGLVAAMQGDYEQAKDFSQESLRLYHTLGDQASMAWPLYSLARVAYNLGEYDSAQYFCEESLTLHRQIGNQRGIADCLSALGLIVCGRYIYELAGHPEAAQLFQENLAICRAIGDREGEARALHNLGYIHSELAQYPQAEDLLQASLTISTAIGDLYLIAATSMWLGINAMQQMQYAEARRYFLESLKIAHETGGLVRAMDVFWRLGELFNREGQDEKAVEYLAFVVQHPATDDRVRGGAKISLDELAALLPVETFTAAQTRGAGRTLNDLVREVLGDRLS